MVSQELARDVVVQGFYYEDSLLIGTSCSSIYIIPHLLSKLVSSSNSRLITVFLFI